MFIFWALWAPLNFKKTVEIGRKLFERFHDEILIESLNVSFPKTLLRSCPKKIEGKKKELLK